MIADIRFAFRQLAKSPGFTAVAIFTLALGIGGNTAIFSVVNAVLLQPLPYPEPDRLVQLCEMPNPRTYIQFASGGAFVDWQDQSTQMESIAAAHSVEKNLTGIGDPIRLDGLEVSADYLRVFGIVPALGRDFLPSDDTSGGNNAVVILSYSIWQTHFGGDPSIIGKLVHLDGKSLEVIGVLPSHALFANNADFLTPSVIRQTSWKLSHDWAYVVSVVGRLKPNATIAHASEELTLSKQAVRALYPAFKQEWTVGMLSLHEHTFGTMRPYVFTLLGAAALVLLIACANVANLLLARATVRQSEIALRIALGATAGRILRQLLTESLLLSLAGGLAGLLLAELSVRPLINFANIPEMAGSAIGLNAPILFFTLVASCATGFLFGIVPALGAARPNLSEQLKEGARGSTIGSRRKAQASLLISEAALTVLLLVSAGLLLRSFLKALNADPGFRVENVLVFDFTVPDLKVPATADRVRLGQRLLERLERIPGVASVGMASSVPMNGNKKYGDLVSREDQPETRNDLQTGFDSVAGDFFPTLEIPLLSGRLLKKEDDTEKAPKVIVVNELLARTLFGKNDPLGRQLHFKDTTWEIIGVVGNVRRFQLDSQPTPQVYFTRTYFPWDTCVVLRTKLPPLTLIQAIRQAVKDVDPELPIANLTTLENSVENTLHVRRIMLVLLGIFAFTALALACVGIYGVISYSITQRTREMGIRIALGANSHQLISLILRQAVKLVMIGLIIGVGASFAAGLLIADQLYGVAPTDPMVMGTVSLILLAVTLLASWLPAKRASRVNPAIALRAD